MTDGELTPRAIDRLLDAAAPLRDRPELGAIDDERYELGEELGRGGMGVVYEAYDRELERAVALKILGGPAGVDEASRQRFLREAKAAARLVHPNIATVYDASPEAIAMQLVHGATLGAKHGFTARELAELVRDAALAIHFAHSEGIVHRDLKPANLMVESGSRPHVYVMDFGLAKERAVDSSLSVSGSIVGTPAYMAPEQAAGRNEEVGPATDVYGLGATLYACLSGHAPFADEDIYALLQKVVGEEPRPLRECADVDRDLATIVHKCLAKEPTARYASALALASDLDRWLRGEPIQARPPSVLYRLRRYASRRQGAITTGVVAAIVVALIAIPFLWQARAKRRDAERVFELMDKVNTALVTARETKKSGVGLERLSLAILDEAIAGCRQYLEESESAHGWFFLGRLLDERGLRERSLAAFDRAASLRPDLDHLALERGVVLAALYRDNVPVLGEEPRPELEIWRRRGAEDLRRAVPEVPEIITADWLFAQGQLAWLTGDLDRAIQLHREVTEFDVGQIESHLCLSRLYLLVGRDELGMRHSVIATDLFQGYRPAYVASVSVMSSGGEEMLPERDLLSLAGMKELLVDFNLLLQTQPGQAHAYGMRGQVQLRQALRAMQRETWLEARDALERAIGEFTFTLVVKKDHAAALVNRGVCRVQLGRVLSTLGDRELAALAYGAALVDYGEALALDPTLAVAYHDRALFHRHRARLAQVAMSTDTARRELEQARDDALEALRQTPETHPWRPRFASFAAELDAGE